MLPIALLLLAPFDDAAEAELLYRRMEAKILTAKSVLVRATVRYEGDLRGEHQVRLRVMKPENLVRYEQSGADRWSEERWLVSDGKRYLSRSGSILEPAIGVDLPDLGATSLVMFSRWGLERGVAGHRWHQEEGKALRRPLLRDFRLLHREEVGPHKTVAITYVQNDWASRAATLWIDEETLLPVQRFQREGGRCMHWTTTESYDEIRFDEAMPAERFRIPE